MKKKQLLLSLFFGGSISVFAQQDIVSSQGDSYTTGNNTIDFTIGEPIIETGTGGSNELTQGFHQTNFTITSVEDFKPELNIKVFPNPTAEILNISSGETTNKTYQIFDTNGKLVKQGTISGANTTVNVVDLSSGTYVLAISGINNTPLKTYQIIKK